MKNRKRNGYSPNSNLKIKLREGKKSPYAIRKEDRPMPNTGNTGGGNNGGTPNSNKQPAAKLPTKIKPEDYISLSCPGSEYFNGKPVSPSYSFDLDLGQFSMNLGSFSLKIKKTGLSKIDFDGDEESKIAKVGLTSQMKFNLNFNVSIGSIEEFLTGLGFELSVGNWLSLVAKVNTSSGYTDWSLVFTRQTINIFDNDSVKLKAKTKIDKYIIIEDSFEIELNQLYAAVLICGVVIGVPAMGAIQIKSSVLAIVNWLIKGGLELANQ